MYEVTILEERVEDLEAREKYWISAGRDRGWQLTNHTDGGEGLSGYQFTEEHRAKISAANKGRQLTEEHREKIRRAARRRPPMSQEQRDAISRGNKGRVASAETRRRQSLALKGRPHRMSAAGRAAIQSSNSRPIIDLMTGEWYPSQRYAAKELGLCLRSVNRVLRGTLKTTGGRPFAYADRKS